MSHRTRVLAAAAACLLAAPGSALAERSAPSGQLTSASATSSSPARIKAPQGVTTPSNRRSSAVASKNLRVTVNLAAGTILLDRNETRQVGTGGAWVVAGAIGLALAPQTAGVGTIAAVAVGVALGSVGSQLISSQLAKGQCLKVTVPWITLGTTARIGWYGCPA